MSISIQLYKEFIDGLTKITKGIYDIWVKERGWPKIPDNDKINKFINDLSDEEKDILSGLLQEAREGGIHDTLAYINEKMDLEELRIHIQGKEIAYQPFDTELHYDWVSRIEGDNWPDID